MRLLEYLQEAQIGDETFAALVGGVSRHAVKKWKYGERKPEADRIIRIEDITEGKVTLRDWLVERATPRESAAGEAAA